MNQRGKLQFDGATVTDDSSNDKTIVTTTPQSMIGDAWAPGQSYAVGDYRIDGNVLYKCKTAHTSSASNRPPYASYWDAVSVTDLIENETLVLIDYVNKSRYTTDYSNSSRYYYRKRLTYNPSNVGEYKKYYLLCLTTTTSAVWSEIIYPEMFNINFSIPVYANNYHFNWSNNTDTNNYFFLDAADNTHTLDTVECRLYGIK